MEISEARPSSEERIWGALAHASLLMFFLGFFIPALIWAVQRKKSGYVAFQALQALGYQVISFTLWILFAFLLPLLLFPLMMGEIAMLGDAQRGAGQDFFPFMSMVITWGVFFGIFVLYFLAGFIGAAFCLAGKEFRYPLLGKWLARFVEYQAEPGPDPTVHPLNEEREDRWVAAMSHATVIVTLWGLILPLIVWVFEKDRSKFLRFQALQALVFQAIGSIVYFAFNALYVMSLFVMLFGFMIILPGADSSAGPLIFIVFFIVILLFLLVFLICMPLYQILGQWAALRILQGRDYQYPLLGRRVRSWMDGPQPQSAQMGETA